MEDRHFDFRFRWKAGGSTRHKAGGPHPRVRPFATRPGTPDGGPKPPTRTFATGPGAPSDQASTALRTAVLLRPLLPFAAPAEDGKGRRGEGRTSDTPVPLRLRPSRTPCGRFAPNRPVLLRPHPFTHSLPSVLSRPSPVPSRPEGPADSAFQPYFSDQATNKFPNNSSTSPVAKVRIDRTAH